MPTWSSPPIGPGTGTCTRPRSGDEPRALYPAPADFAEPQWVFGMNPYVVLPDGRLLCNRTEDGRRRLAVLDRDSGTLTDVPVDGEARSLTAATSVDGASVDGRGRVAAVLAHPDRPPELVTIELADGGVDVIRVAGDLPFESSWVSVARPVSWPSDDGEVYGWFYPPTSPDGDAPENELPPLMVLSHGGPTGFSPADFGLAKQFWTSRGVAVLDVNYGGSAGYGRAYRERLRGRWGIVDVRDCAEGATAMGEQGLADPRRLAIMGGSAGGYTTLRALTATRTFSAGISLFGVGDLETLARDTHKFESRYLDGLVGPYPQDRAVYADRSPVNHVNDLAAPILLLQGSDDKVVPPNQAEDDGGSGAGETPAGRAGDLSRRGPWVPAGGHDQGVVRGPAVLPRPDLRLHSGRRRPRAAHREHLTAPPIFPTDLATPPSGRPGAASHLFGVPRTVHARCEVHLRGAKCGTEAGGMTGGATWRPCRWRPATAEQVRHVRARKITAGRAAQPTAS